MGLFCMASSPFICRVLFSIALATCAMGFVAPKVPAPLEKGGNAGRFKMSEVRRSDLTALRAFEQASEPELQNDTSDDQGEREEPQASKIKEEKQLKKKQSSSKVSVKNHTAIRRSHAAPRGSLRSRTPVVAQEVAAGNKSTGNGTENVSEVVEEVSSPFVKVTDNITKETGETEIVAASIASPSTILSTFILMYVPLAMAWSFYVHHGKQQVHFALLLPVTYCFIQVGQDLVNQSLAVALKSPMAITLLQGGAMMIISFVWMVTVELPEVVRLGMEPLRAWLPTALLFATYQLVNHLVWWRCSLSERTVFTNLTPAATLVFELLVLQPTTKGGPPGSFRAKMALMLMVAGAVLFSIQYPDFTFAGISVASLMVITTIPYRLSQRFYFSQRPYMPIGTLCFIDSFILFGPAFAMSKSNLDHFWATLFMWFEQPSIVIMLISSIFAFTAHHVTSLMMLREGSATTYLVFNNLANFAVVGMGITFFGDHCMQTPLVITGLTISLGSGLWYAVEVQPSGTWDALSSAGLTTPFLTDKQPAIKSSCAAASLLAAANRG